MGFVRVDAKPPLFSRVTNPVKTAVWLLLREKELLESPPITPSFTISQSFMLGRVPKSNKMRSSWEGLFDITLLSIIIKNAVMRIADRVKVVVGFIEYPKIME